MLVVAIDIGGTFTDLIGFDERTEAFIQAKSLTTPAQLVRGIIILWLSSAILSILAHAFMPFETQYHPSTSWAAAVARTLRI